MKPLIVILSCLALAVLAFGCGDDITNVIEAPAFCEPCQVSVRPTFSGFRLVAPYACELDRNRGGAWAPIGTFQPEEDLPVGSGDVILAACERSDGLCSCASRIEVP